MKLSFENSPLLLFSGKQFTLAGEFDLGDKGLHLLIGENGAGKTMLLNTLAAVLGKQDSGPVDSIDINTVKIDPPKSTSYSVARVRQDPRENFISRCSSDEIILPFLHPDYTREEIIERIDKLLDKCDIKEKDILQRPIDWLSSGEQQLLACCVAFAPTPKLILLDEPFARLDRDAVRRISNLIRSIIDTSIVIVSTHATALFSEQLLSYAHSVIRVERKIDTLCISQTKNLSEGGFAGLTQFNIVNRLHTKLSVPTEHSSERADLDISPRENLLITPGLGKCALKSKKLEMKIRDKVIARLLDVSVNTGINLAEGANGSGKSLFGQFLAGMIPLNPIVSRSKKQVTGTIELPLHPHSSLASIRRRGGSVFIPATADMWLPEQTVDSEIKEFHGSGLNIEEQRLIDHAGIKPEQRLSQLSFGQKRVLALTALPSNLDFVYLDEPFADLSVPTSHLLLDLIIKRTCESDWKSVVISLVQPEVFSTRDQVNDIR